MRNIWRGAALFLFSFVSLVTGSAEAQQGSNANSRSGIPFLFGFRIEAGAAFPDNSPELIGFSQNLDLTTGFRVSGGPFIAVPLAPKTNIGPFDLRFGVDAFHGRLNTTQIANQFIAGVLPVSGSWVQSGIIPYLGVTLAPAFLTTGLGEVRFHVDGGYGVAWNDIDIRRAAPLITGTDTTGIWRARFGFDFPVAPNIRLGASASYINTPSNDWRVVASGAAGRFGSQQAIVIAGTLSADIVWRDGFESGNTAAWQR